MRLPSSFRDPSGNVFTKDGVVFRRVALAYRDHYHWLMESGLYEELLRSGLLVRHQEMDPDVAGSEGAYKILKPEHIPFISYPYEWGFSQLKDAALTTLEVQKKALAFGMTLKDASAYNIQFLKGRPVLIDTLSFQKYPEGEPWAAYGQFCRHFLAPLFLISYQHIGAAQLSRVYIDGIPLDLASALLPARTRLRLAVQMHIHWHARLQKKFASESGVRTGGHGLFRLRAFFGLIDSLESTIKRLRWRPARSEWADYYQGDAYAPDALDHKVQMVTSFLNQVRPKTVWDLGANTGLFSRLASDMGIETISFDRDPWALEQSYAAAVKRKETKILPLLLDLTNPSPGLGWANRERASLVERGPADMLLALALIHHLAIGANLPMDMIAAYLKELGSWALVEFVPKTDPGVALLLATREDIFPDYTQDNFEKEFSALFEIESQQRLNNAERTLYLMRGK